MDYVRGARLQYMHGVKMVAGRLSQLASVCQYIKEVIDSLTKLKDIAATDQLRDQYTHNLCMALMEGEAEAAQIFLEYPDASTERWEEVDNKPRRPGGIVAATAAIGDLDVFLALEPTIIDIPEKPETLLSALELAVSSIKTGIKLAAAGHTTKNQNGVLNKNGLPINEEQIQALFQGASRSTIKYLLDVGFYHPDSIGRYIPLQLALGAPRFNIGAFHPKRWDVVYLLITVPT
ncbi:hypothetical protein E8E11_009784 [Didymella keratinophila]|nr:hypothetical protein E8E11_009784 [Didymella keratinophila]